MQTLISREMSEKKRSRARRAVLLALGNRWDDAVAVNRTILSDFPDDLGANNRLGKALSELGRNREAKQAFQRALQVSPHNTIARKNLDRLMSLGDQETALPTSAGKPQLKAFIEESGKTATTVLVNLAPPQALLKLVPGRPVNLATEQGRIKVTDAAGGYIGSLEPKIAARLMRLMLGGNEYQATITGTGVGFQELTIIIRETYKHPSQAGVVSFPSRGSSDYHAYLGDSLFGEGLLADDDEADVVNGLGGRIIKDWSDDDTEPGDDEVFAPPPIINRIINSSSDEDDDVNGY